MNSLIPPNADAIPYIPENAPFSAEQRAYLNGFLAGLFSRVAQPAGMEGSQSAPQTLEPLTVLFGSQTGTAEGLAKRIAKEATKLGFAPTVYDLSKYDLKTLSEAQCVLLVTSTYGDGEPPDNAKSFWEAVHDAAAPRLEKVRYSVLALGDRNYPHFCECGKGLDNRFAALGATRVFDRTDCDVEYEEPFNAWLGGALQALKGESTAEKSATARDVASIEVMRPIAPEPASPVYGRQNPFPASLVTNRRLTAADTDRDRRHFEISVEGSDLQYETGDALGVIPSNCPALVQGIVAALGCTGDEPIADDSGRITSLKKVLTVGRELGQLTKTLLERFAKMTQCPKLAEVTGANANGHLKEFQHGRDVLDLLLAYPDARLNHEEFVRMLPKMRPRLYSIASSPKLHPRHVHLTVAIVRYESLGRQRSGVCSSFMADRVGPDAKLPVFIQPNKKFRLPADPTRPVIMVGPGTGIAPFRGFLQDRQATGAKGKSWLFFGEQHERSDYLYREELQSFLVNGALQRLDAVFSRDQERKIYVQDRMKEHAPELYAWLEEGAYFYVCGDATRMAKDVDAMLHQIVASQGGMTQEASSEYVQRLRTDGRYLRDVY